jgi:glutathione synthase/RimK-type ligase-like ATP-grasp enzyme
MLQKRVLIISYARDLHARAVAYAIRAKGHICKEFYCADYPTLASITLMASSHIDSAGSVLCHADGSFDIGDDKFDTIWLRRRPAPYLPPSMNPGDREVASRQCERGLSDLIAALDRPGVFWVNPLECEITSYLKMYQLRHAQRAGLTIPETLISNNPNDIREFIARCNGKAIHKLQQNAMWKSQDGNQVFGCYTAPVTCSDLPRDATLRLSPGIFQPLLKKQFEVRVACCGNYLMAVRIDSQSDDRASIDWRAGQWYVDMTPHLLPEETARGIRRFLDSTGLAHASLDFIVDENGEYIFLEANPQGQFLWMEDRAEMPILDIFTQYLIAGRRDFHPQLDNAKVILPQFKQVWDGGLKESVQKHVLVGETMSVPDYVA